MHPISDYLKRYQQMGHEAFVREQADPVLVHHPDAADASVDRLFKTTAVDAQSIQRLLQRPTAGEAVVYSLSKRTGGQFPERISVGRTRASDVRLDYPQISKFHAYFAVNPSTGDMTVTDANATNGTFLNGKRLLPNAPETVGEGAVIMFGSHGFAFYTPEGLGAYLRRSV